MGISQHWLLLLLPSLLHKLCITATGFSHPPPLSSISKIKRHHAISSVFRTNLVPAKTHHRWHSDRNFLNAHSDLHADATTADEHPIDNNDSSSAALGAWVPIGSSSALTGLGPTRMKVMGVDLVVWESDDTTAGRHDKTECPQRWSVMKDACSHKFAALSQGRVNPDTNCIECPYHGWQFDADGTLACIPQMESTISEQVGNVNIADNTCNLSSALVEKASIQSYSAHVTGDLIWAFLPTSVHGESFPKDLLPEHYYHNGLMRDIESDANFAVLELPASYDFFMENAMDPSHFSFAHHGVIGKRKDAAPFPIELIPSNFTHVSFTTRYKRKGEFRERTYGIQRPFNVFTLEKDMSNGNWKPGALFFFVPIEEGRVRLITTIGNNKLSTFPWPNWIIHQLSWKLSEGDCILHDAELNIRSRDGNSNSSENYITPTSADKGVISFRNWWRKYGLSKSPPHTFGPASPHSLRSIPRNEYANPWMIHTKTCAHCRRALQNARWLEKWGLVFGFFGSLCASGFGRGRPTISLLAASLGLVLSSIGKKTVIALEGSPHLSDVPDRAISLN